MDFGQLRLGWTQQQGAEFSHSTLVRNLLGGLLLIEDALCVGPRHEICTRLSKLAQRWSWMALVIAGDLEIVVQSQRHLGEECRE